MNKKERAVFIQKRLNEYFPRPKAPLITSSTYELLIAVLLSAQSTDKQVNRVTSELFKRAHTPKKMLSLTLDELASLIRSCGLSRKKAEAILALSRILIEKHKGRVPKSLVELEELPGVGHKTASVVMTMAYNVPTFPVDTHIFRSAQRWGLSKGKTREKVESDLKKLFPERSWRKLHLQIIYFSRQFCPALGHKSESCPICSVLKK